ncbi:MAG TPA: hypothetical protein VG816_08465 [Solirubrobacterales bacterium]|nr:hypothetical protein [Solirubrobacterales bacterium]
MSSDLIALVVAVTLGVAVVGLGLRRNLSETTRSRLPRYETDSEREPIALGLYGGGQRRHQPASPRQRRWMIGGYLLMSLTWAAFAVLSPDRGLFDALLAAGFALNAAVLWLKKAPPSSDGSLSD